MKAITVARQVGSWGDFIGISVAKAIGMRYIDRETITNAAEQAGITESSIERMESPAGLLGRLVNAISGMPIVPSVASQAMRFSEINSLVATVDERVQKLIQEGFTPAEAARHIVAMRFPEVRTKHDYASLIRSVVEEFADTGNVVLAGSGSQMILKDRPDVLHVLIVAPVDTRIKAIMEQEGVSRKVSERRVKENDEARTAFFKNNFNVNWLDTILYDLVINTGRISKDLAVELIVKTAQNFS